MLAHHPPEPPVLGAVGLVASSVTMSPNSEKFMMVVSDRVSWKAKFRRRFTERR
jgi:hypothetical protein